MKNSLFTQYQQMRLKRPQGQVAVLFILLLAVVFVFMAVTYNVGLISSAQTGLNNAADAAALLGASYLGSYAYVVYQYNNFQMDRCETSINILNIVNIIVAVVLTIASFGAASPLIPLGAFASGVNVIRNAIGGSTNTELTGMSYTDQITTKILQTAIFGLSNDPNTVLDENDLDQDTLTNDQISAVQDWDNRRVAFLKSNFITSLTTWNCLANQAAGVPSECAEIGPLGALLNRIDGGHVYVDANRPIGSGDGSLNLTDANFDFHPYLNDEFIPLLENILIRFYYLGFIRPAPMPAALFSPEDPGNPDALTSIELIRDAVHSTIVEDTNNLCQDNSFFSYHCGRWGSGHSQRTYTYNGLYMEGQCSVSGFNPANLNFTEPCDRVKNLIREMDEFVEGVESVQLLKGKAESYTPEFVLDYMLNPYNTAEDAVNLPGWTGHKKISWYTKLKSWQEQIIIWRGLLQSVLPPQQALIQDCYNMCSGEICNVLSGDPSAVPPIPPSTNCTLVNPACEKLAGLMKFETDISYDRAYTEVVGGAYEPLTEECCMGPDRTKCSRPSSQLNPGNNWDCANEQGRVNWGCYSTCYNQEYWFRHPAFSVTADERRSCADFCLPMSQPLICYWGTPGCQSTFNPAYGGINCNFVCQRACRAAFNTEHGSLGPSPTTTLFDAKIQRALNILGDPNNQAAGGLYWEIEALLPEMEQAYNQLKNDIGAMRHRAIYAWKDADGWHLIMAETGTFSTPSSYMTSDSSWLGIKQEVCQHVTLGSNPNIDVWVWRYDQGREVNFAGKAKMPWWTMRTGRKDVEANEPAFMRNSAINNWKELNLLDPDTSEQQVGCFLCEYGLRAHSRAHYGVEEYDNNITSVRWESPAFCGTCP